jgi:hypothetical protein
MRRLKSLEKIVKEEVLKKRSNVLDNAIFDYDNIKYNTIYYIFDISY